MLASEPNIRTNSDLIYVALPFKSQGHPTKIRGISQLAFCKKALIAILDHNGL